VRVLISIITSHRSTSWYTLIKVAVGEEKEGVVEMIEEVEDQTEEGVAQTEEGVAQTEEVTEMIEEVEEIEVLRGEVGEMIEGVEERRGEVVAVGLVTYLKRELKKKLKKLKRILNLKPKE
jgi:hypothetical protein